MGAGLPDDNLLGVGAQALRAIAARASFVWERLDGARFEPETSVAHAADVERRMERWRRLTSHGREVWFERRLRWEGLERSAVEAVLGDVRLREPNELPAWARTLGEIVMSVRRSPRAPFATPRDALPFEEVLRPIIVAARAMLEGRLQRGPVAQRERFASFGAAARDALERALLERLAQLFVEPLYQEFLRKRPFGRALLGALAALGAIDEHAPERAPSRARYEAFVAKLLEDGLLGLFQRLPVLGRLTAVLVSLWVDTTAELVRHLDEDAAAIEACFSPDRPLGRVDMLDAALSDPHNGGRTVSILGFEGGLRLVYKPKSVALEAAYNALLAWCNARGAPSLRTLRVLERGTHGWVECAARDECGDRDAAARFFERCGSLLALLHALRCTDCHNENLFASGEHPLLIDAETLMTAESELIGKGEGFAGEDALGRSFYGSILRTGMLPRWDLSADGKRAFDISGLGVPEDDGPQHTGMGWVALNTDDMHWGRARGAPPSENNGALLAGKALEPSGFGAELARGFASMYRFLLAERGDLLAADGPLVAFRDKPVRFIFRATRTYGVLRDRLARHELLASGVDFSIELDQLALAFLATQERPEAWRLLAAERRALERLDIPFFFGETTTTSLDLEGDAPLPARFRRSGYDDVVHELTRLDTTDLDFQLAILRDSLDARVARRTTDDGARWDEPREPAYDGAAFVEEARQIGLELERRAIPEASGAASWLGVSHLAESDRFQLTLVDDDLYSGRSGIAVFLAALDSVTGEPRFRELTLRALAPLRKLARRADDELRESLARQLGIGGAGGLGSMVYALVRVSRFLDDPELLEDARRLAALITPDLVTRDKALDVMAGSAGCALALLALFRVDGDPATLARARVCGDHLLRRRTPHEGAPAWRTIDGCPPLTGFSHGAAGIAVALERLHTATGESAYRDAAREAIAFERRVYSAERENWPDLRPNPDGAAGFPVQWCHGAAGVALARLGCVGPAGIAGVDEEARTGVATTRRNVLQHLDHLCCGNLGRLEVLLVASERGAASDLAEEAREKAAWVVARARRNGGYTLYQNLPPSVFNPGLFQGTAGIGYELLRLATPGLPSLLLWE